jgi:hypothetical protein
MKLLVIILEVLKEKVLLVLLMIRQFLLQVIHLKSLMFTIQIGPLSFKEKSMHIKTVAEYPNLPKCPEVCRDCEQGKHIACFQDELGELSISLSEDGHHLLIKGYTEAGDLFWLSRILDMAAREIKIAQELEENPAEKERE